MTRTTTTTRTYDEDGRLVEEVVVVTEIPDPIPTIPPYRPWYEPTPWPGWQITCGTTAAVTQ